MNTNKYLNIKYLNINQFHYLFKKYLFGNLKNYNDGHGMDIFDKKDIIILISRLKKIKKNLKFRSFITCFKNEHTLNEFYLKRFPKSNEPLIEMEKMIHTLPSKYLCRIPFSYGGFEHKKQFFDDCVLKFEKMKINIKYEIFVLPQILKRHKLTMFNNEISYFLYGFEKNRRNFLLTMMFE